MTDNKAILSALADLIGHAKWVAAEFDIHYAHLEEAETALTAALSVPTPTSSVEPSEQMPVAWRLEPVQRIDRVSYDTGYREPAEPMWRVQVSGYCADFETETAANNFHAAITALAASSPPQAGDWGGVKALEWREEPIPPAWECLASTGVGLYCIPLGRNLFVLRFRDKDTLGEFSTLDAAKAAAQQDYEQRILSALVLAPHPVAPTEGEIAELIERLHSPVFGTPTALQAAAAIEMWKARAERLADMHRDMCVVAGEATARAETAEASAADLHRKLEEAMKALEELTRSFAIYTVEDDDGIRFATHGVLIVHHDEHSPEGIALLRLDALARALTSGAEQ